MRQKPTLWSAMPLLYCSVALLALPVSASFAQSTQEQKQPPAQSQQAPAATQSQAPSSEPKRDEQKSTSQSDSKPQTQGQAPSSAPAAPTTAQQPAKQDQKAQSPAKSGTQTTQTPPKSGTSQQTQSPAATKTTPPAGTAATPSSPQPSTASTPSGSSTAATPSASLSDQQRASISTSISQANVQPLRNANFSVSVGTVIPSTVRYYPVTPAIISVYPQYRGYSYVVVEEEIIIIEPRTRKIVQVVRYEGGGRAAVRSKLKLTDKQRGVIRTSVKRPSATTTTGSAAVEKEIVLGDRLPETVVIERFPDTVYRSVPSMRSYQYIARDRGIYVVDPRERRVIDLID